MIVISDNSPISALLAINQLDLLKKLYGEIIIPLSVMQELQKLGDRGQDISSIDKGEAETILLSQELNAELLLMDEQKGRNIAKSLGIRVIGLLGILTGAKQIGLIPSLKNVLEEARIKSKFRISQKLIQDALKLVGEQ